MSDWIRVCSKSELEENRTVQCDRDGWTYVLHRRKSGAVLCTDWHIGMASQIEGSGETVSNQFTGAKNLDASMTSDSQRPIRRNSNRRYPVLIDGNDVFIDIEGP